MDEGGEGGGRGVGTLRGREVGRGEAGQPMRSRHWPLSIDLLAVTAIVTSGGPRHPCSPSPARGAARSFPPLGTVFCIFHPRYTSRGTKAHRREPPVPGVPPDGDGEAARLTSTIPGRGSPSSDTGHSAVTGLTQDEPRTMASCGPRHRSSSLAPPRPAHCRCCRRGRSPRRSSTAPGVLLLLLLLLP